MKEKPPTVKVPRNPTKFSPRWVSSLCTVLLIPFFVYLGFWQLSRGEEKQQIQSELETRTKLPALELSNIRNILLMGIHADQLRPEIWDNLRYRQLNVTGTLLNDKQILLDNQIVEGKVGYRVLTPLVVQKKQATDNTEILLIDRGWIPMGQNREDLPSIVPIEGEISLSGILNQPSYGLALKGKAEDKWPLRVQRIDFKTLRAELGQELIPVLLQLKVDDVYGFEIPQPSFKISAERHLGYAVQWFTLALATLIYYLVISRRPRLKTCPTIQKAVLE